MKINKILAAGVAATLAVTSLATVAGAETKSQVFDMETTLGKIVYKPAVTGSQNVTPGDRFKYVPGETYTLTGCPEVAVDTNGDGIDDYRDVDAFIPIIVSSTTDAGTGAPNDGVALIDRLGTLSITVTGKKLGAIAGTQEPEVQKITLQRFDVFERIGAVDTLIANYILPIYVTDAPGDAFIPERFVAIDNIKVEATGAKDITFDNLEKDIYNKVKTLIDNKGERHLQVDAGNTNAGKYDYDGKAVDHYQRFDLENAAGTILNGTRAKLDIDLGWDPATKAAANVYDAAWTVAGLAAVNAQCYTVVASAAGTPRTIVGAAVGHGANMTPGTDKGGDLINELNILLSGGLDIDWEANEGSTSNHMAFVERTTVNPTIMRADCWILSGTDAYFSQTQNATNQAVVTDTNQTYKDSGLGTAPKYFGGLAGQVADFFNKQNNGKIIFTFTAHSTTDAWKDGGVPSTEVGLRNSLAGTAMALFFNYNHSTGSLNTIGEVDADKCTITFDISNILDDMGGFTKGNISDIYYGLNKGLAYNNATYGNRVGYIVEKVELQYEDAPAAVDAAADDDAAAVVVADDDDDDDVIADDDFDDDDIIADDDDDDYDDDDDAGIIEDDDDDDTDVNNDVDYVDGDDDANPGTGVGLAVIPAIVAAAAVVVSKKRK